MDIVSFNKKSLINNDSYQNFVESETFEIGFKEHYYEHLLPLVRSYEIDRIAALKKSQSNRRKAIPFMILMPFFSFFLIYITEFDSNFFEPLIWANIGVYSALFAYIRRSLKQYSSSIKSQIFPNFSLDNQIYRYFPKFHNASYIRRVALGLINCHHGIC